MVLRRNRGQRQSLGINVPVSMASRKDQ